MDLEKINQYNEQQKAKSDKQAAEEAQKQLNKDLADSVKSGAKVTTSAILSANKKTTEDLGKELRQSGDKILGAMQQSQGSVADALNNLVLATVISKDPAVIDTAKQLAALLTEIAKASSDFKGSKLNLLPVANEKLASSIDKLANNVVDKPDRDYTKDLDAIRKQIAGLKLDVQPVVNIPETKLDIEPVVTAVNELNKAIGKQKAPNVSVDTDSIVKGLESVKSTISNLSFPVPNYVLPFSQDGKATQVVLDANGKVPIAGTISVDTTGLATDTNQTSGSQKTQIVDAGGEIATVTGGKLDVNATASLAGDSLPVSGATTGVSVAIVDGSGNQITSFGGGTQYTEDAAAAADPVGTMPVFVRKDTPAATVSADGDVIAQRGTNYGASYVTLLDTSGSAVSVGGGTQYDEDTAHVSGDKVTMAGVVQQAADAALSSDGDRSLLQVDATGFVKVNVKTSVLPTGAATGAKQDTGNTSIASIDTKTPALGQALAASSVPVVLTAAQITTLTPPAAITGFSTSTKQSDGSQKSQIVDGAGNVIGATSNALDINIKSGNPTSITANAGTNLNTSALALDATLAGAIKAEDVASADGDKGIPAMAVRKATPANTSGTDGDYENLQMSAGRLWVDASGKTLTVDGSGVTQPVSLASVPSHAVTNAGTFAVQASEADGANVTLGAKADAKSTATDTTAVTMMQVMKQISASVQAPPSQAVTNAGTFAVQATLAAETTKVIGTVRNSDGSGNLWTSNSTTYTAKFGQDSNLLGTLGTAFSTAGKVDVKAADGDVFVRQATASNLNATVVGTGTFAVQSSAVAPTTIFNGKKTVTTAGTRVTLAASQAVKSVVIKALAANTGIIYVGDTAVASTNGFALAAGEILSLDIANLNTVNLDASVNGEGVTYIGTN